MRQEFSDVLYTLFLVTSVCPCRTFGEVGGLFALVNTGSSSERLDEDDDDDDDGRTEGPCRIPLSSPYLSVTFLYLRLGRTLSNIDRYLQSSKLVFPKRFSVVTSFARPSPVLERRPFSF